MGNHINNENKSIKNNIRNFKSSNYIKKNHNNYIKIENGNFNKTNKNNSCISTTDKSNKNV